MALDSPFIAHLHKDFCHRGTTSFVAQGGKILCMHIGDVVQRLMIRDGLNYADVAARVRAAGAPTVRYQSIQQLVAKGVKRPKYEVELAKAFGLSVEDLRAGRIDKAQLTEVPKTQELSQGTVRRSTSQSLGLDRALLLEAVKLLRRLEISQDKLLSPQDFADSVVEAYEAMAGAMKERSEPVGADG